MNQALEDIQFDINDTYVASSGGYWRIHVSVMETHGVFYTRGPEFDSLGCFLTRDESIEKGLEVASEWPVSDYDYSPCISSPVLK